MSLDSIIESSVLGFLQGITEWIPISSEGLITLASTLLWGRHFEDAVELALWLHIGTAASALIYFKKEFASIINKSLSAKTESHPLTSFLIFSSIGTAFTGIPLIMGLHAVSAFRGSQVMIFIGLLVTLNGLIQMNQNSIFQPKKFNTISLIDSILVGLIQGLSALPGLSRSGLTISFLLFRKYDSESALYLSFLMSVPASLGAVLIILLMGEFSFPIESILGSIIAFAIGVLTIHLIITTARKIKFSPFLIISGLILITGGVIGLQI